MDQRLMTALRLASDVHKIWTLLFHKEVSQGILYINFICTNILICNGTYQIFQCREQNSTCL